MPKSNFNPIGLAAIASRVSYISCLLLWLASLQTALAQNVEMQNPAPEFIKTSLTEQKIETLEIRYYDDTRTHIIVCFLIIGAYGLYWHKESKS